MSVNLYSQKITYSIEAGANYSFFTNSEHKTQDQETHTIYTSSGGYYTITAVDLNSSEKKISSKGKTGFFINNNFSFPVNKFIRFKTGFGLSLNNADLTTKVKDLNYTTFSFYEYENKATYNIFQIKIPLQLQLSFFNEKLLLSNGISISAIINAKNTFETNATNSYTYIADNDFENIFVNFNSGFEYNIFKKVYIGVQYEYSATKLMTENTSYQTQSFYMLNYNKIHLNNISLNLSYKF